MVNLLLSVPAGRRESISKTYQMSFVEVIIFGGLLLRTTLYMLVHEEQFSKLGQV